MSLTLAPAPAPVTIGPVAPVIQRAGLLVAETVVIPAGILWAFVRLGEPMLGLVAVFCWRSACVALRLVSGRTVPTTVWLAFGLFSSRTVSGLAATSVAVYLWQPIVISAISGLLFMATAFTARPLTMRLARDFVALPSAVADDQAVRRLFRDLALWWGGVHVLCAGIGAWSMTLPTDQAVAITGGLGIVCTAVSAAGCVGWSVLRVRSIPGLSLGRATLAA